MPNVNDHHHDGLMEEFKDHLKKKGYLWYEADYGSIAGDDCKDTLRKRTAPSSVFLRTRADRIAVRHDCEFEFDAKTKQNAYDDIAIEALPLIHHSLIFSYFALRCIYAFRWIQRECPDVGFFVDMEFCSLVDTVWIFTWRDDMAQVNEWMRQAQPTFFPNAEVRELRGCRGSGDPMAIVSAHKARKMPHWERLVP